MTDITELAQSLKAAAEKATQGRWEYYPGNTSIEYNVDSMDEDQGSIVYVDSGDFTQAQTDRNGEFIALANPANILALVEALETEKRICATWRKTAESTSEKLEKAQAAERDEFRNRLKLERSILEDADKCIAELESRTVKLPKLKMLEDYLAEVAIEERKQILVGVKLEFHRACVAAGIKVEAE